MLTINLSVLWPEAISALKRIASHNVEIVWNVIYEQLTRFEDETRLAEDSLTPALLTMFDAMFNEELQQIHPAKETVSGQGNLSLTCPSLTRLLRARQLTMKRYNEQRHMVYYQIFVAVSI
jgi:hypothetical protein